MAIMNRKIIYFDNAAAFRTDGEIVEAFCGYSSKYYANPEGWNCFSKEVAGKLRESARLLSNTLVGDDSLNTFWTHSATDAINTAFGYFKDSGNILCAPNEHPAILAVLENRSESLKVDEYGLLNLDDLRTKLSPDTRAVVVHHVQNETGAVENLIEVGKIVNSVSDRILLIVDTVQALGKVEIPWNEAGINIAFGAGHKIGFSTGGALFHRLKGNELKSFEKYLNDLRGVFYKVPRPDPAVGMAFADAVVKMQRDLAGNRQKVSEINLFLRDAIKGLVENVRFLVPYEYSSPYILSFIIPGIQAEVLVRILSASYGVMISAGSACKAASGKASRALLATGLNDSDARSMLRVSFSHLSTIEEAELFCEYLKNALKDY